MPNDTPGIQWVDLDGLRIDSTYQRDLDQRRVLRMVREWDPRRNDPLLVSERAGIRWNVDGQHRAAAMHEMGQTVAQATVLYGLTQQQEADLFVLRQKDRKSLTAWDLFKAETIALHPDVLAVIDIAHRNGFRVARDKGLDRVQAVSAVRRIYDLPEGEEILDLTLSTVRTLWSGDPLGVNGQILEGLAMFFHSVGHDARYDHNRTFKILQTTPPARIIREGRNIAEQRRSGTTNASNMGEAILNLYNAKLPPTRKIGPMLSAGKRRLPGPYGEGRQRG